MMSLAAFIFILNCGIAAAVSTPGDIASVSNSKQAPNISDSILTNVKAAHDFEISNYANGTVEQDPFYLVPAYASNAKAGDLLKVEIKTNTSQYTIPPNTALSRIMFASKNLNGSVVPASAYVLWPFDPREADDGYPVVAFAHGNSGSLGNCAPSHLRSLWYHFAVPFELALQGYVVIAPDYLGLGVNRDHNGQPIFHNFLANPAEANDLFYAVEAAQKAFPKLSGRFVTMGHSQGGGAAWAAAHRQAEQPVQGYLGTIPISAVTRFLEEKPGVIHNSSSGTALLIAHGLKQVFPQFELSEVLTPKGIERLEYLRQIQGCNAVVSQLFPDVKELVHRDWASNRYIQAYQDLTQNGNRAIAGPMLILQGTADPSVPDSLTTSAVNRTCQLNNGSSVEYIRFQDVGHTPTCYASRRIWLEWIAARFASASSTSGCHRRLIKSALPYVNYQSETDFVLKHATLRYELA